MYTEPAGTSAVPAFLSKLWRLVDSSQNNDLITWSTNGKSFIIRNQAKFSKELLPLYFKHNNMASFIRQLNMYGFRKITHIENSGLKVENDEIEFYHSCFVKGQENMLEYIKRKNSLSVTHAKSNGTIDEKPNKEEVHMILTDVKGIKDKQDNLDDMLVNLQTENESLWKEIATLRHKHQKQQQIVEKLIHFLMSLVQNGNIGLKRKAQLMIDGNKNNIKSGNDLSNLLAASSGPIIQEITHGLLDDDDDELQADVDSPIVNTARSDTSEPVPQMDEASHSPIFHQQTQPAIESIEIGDTVGQSLSDNYTDPLQQSINAINDDQILDLEAVGAVQIDDSQLLSSNTTQNSQVNENFEHSNQSTLTSHQQLESTNLLNDQTNLQVVNKSSSNLKLVMPTADSRSGNTKPIQSENLTACDQVLSTPTLTATNFDNHIEEIDTDLNSLHEQLLLRNFNIDPNTLMGLFSQDDSQKNIDDTNQPSSSNILHSPLSTPKPIVQSEQLPHSCGLNSDFELCEIVDNSEMNNFTTSDDNLFDNQNELHASLDLPSFEPADNAPIFNADDLLNSEADLDQLFNLRSEQTINDDPYSKDKKKRRVS